MKKRLFEFLQDAYKNEEQMRADREGLKGAIKEGACTLSEWKPDSVFGRAKTSSTERP